MIKILSDNIMKIFFLILLITLIICYFNNYFTIEKFSNLEQVDVVYTWVDHNDNERIKYQNMILKKNDLNLDVGRYRNNEELKYSLRSLEKYCPWIRYIFVVVKDGQKPSFINFNNKKIKLVNHSEIMPKSSLPTFNSLAIELCLHKIKDLSDHYIYMNDDLFILKHTSRYDFFNPNNFIPFINYTKENNEILNIDYSDSYQFSKLINNSLILSNQITKQNITVDIFHRPSICYKPWEYEIEKQLKNFKIKNTNLWEHTVNSKFRKNDNIALNSCLRQIYYKYKGSVEKNFYDVSKTIELTKNNCSIDIKTLYPFTFLCINDIDDSCKNDFKNLMSKLFNDKSSFEL